MKISRSLPANLLLAAASLFVCLLLLEAAARLLLRPEVPHGLPLSRFHPVLGWEKTPGVASRIHRAEYDVEVRINSKGLRGPERPYEKPPGTRRVMILGDSFGEGYYVAEEASVRSLLEAALRPSCPVEVINGSTAGYSTDQEYLFFHSEGVKYSPDLVVVFFFSNDILDNTLAVGNAGRPKPLFVQKTGGIELANTPLVETPSSAPSLRTWHGSAALRFLSDRTEANPALHRRLAALGIVAPLSSQPPHDFWPFRKDHRREVKDAWQRTSAILEKLKEEVESAGGHLAVLYVPIRFEVNEDAWNFTLQRYPPVSPWDREGVVSELARRCAALGIRMVDPREALRRDDAAKGAYFPRDGHWNEAGNAAAEAALLPLVQEQLACPIRP